MTHPTKTHAPQFSDIEAAAQRISGKALRTPLINSARLDDLLGCELWCKCENLQHTGAFKFRGATNAVLQLREQGIDVDVATHSSGNHGAALACAARADGRGASVVMPENSVRSKIKAVQSHLANVIFCAPNQAAREAGLAELVRQGLIAIPPYDHTDIIAGQGTVALEMLAENPNLDIIMAPVGGGGLISGVSIAARNMVPDIRIIAAEPAGAADTADSLKLGQRIEAFTPDTIADGLRAKVGEITFPVIQQLVEQVLTVSEQGLLAAMQMVYETMDMVIEPSSATVIAAIMEYPDIFHHQRVGVVFSGGNVDREAFSFLRSSA